MLAGSSRLRYASFTCFNTPAVILGIGQFIVIGYVSGSQARTWLGILRTHAWIGLATAGVIALLVLLLHGAHRRAMRAGIATRWAR